MRLLNEAIKSYSSEDIDYKNRIHTLFSLVFTNFINSSAIIFSHLSNDSYFSRSFIDITVQNKYKQYQQTLVYEQ